MYQPLKKILERFEAMAMAVAFAEAGEWSTAKQIAYHEEDQKPTAIKRKNNQSRKQPRIRA